MSLVAIKNLVASKLSPSKPEENTAVDESSPLIRSKNNSSNNDSGNDSGLPTHPPHSEDLLNTDLESGRSHYSPSVRSSASTSASQNQTQNQDRQEPDSFPMNLIHNVDPRVMSDLIIGLSDGLTVPFALTAGLSSLGDSKLVITGGMAELVSGAISMGLGGYLAAKSESEFYYSQVKKEKQLFFQSEDSIADELYDIIIDMGATESTTESFVMDLSKNPQAMIDFIIRYGKGLEEPPEGRIVSSAFTIGSGYFFGGFIPLIPYFFFATVAKGLLVSVLVMLLTLFWFGYLKSMISMGPDCTRWTRVSEGIQMVFIGSIAAGSAWTLVYLIDN